MITRTLLASLLLLAPAGAQPLKGCDVWGTERIPVSSYCDDLRQILSHPENRDRAVAVFQLSRKIEREHRVHSARLSVIQYFGSDAGFYATLDVVERPEQLPPFVPSPPNPWFVPFDGTDPGELLAAWQTYEDTAFKLIGAGHAHTHGPTCPVHCLHGFEHPEEAPFRERFVQGSVTYREQLTHIFHHDPDDSRRGTAAFVLAHLPDPQEVVQILSPRLLDESSFVRNNVARVFADVASRQPTVELPLHDVLTLLECPETTDRNKAAAILNGLLSRPRGVQRYGDPIRREAGPTLLRMLRLQQPNNHNFAHSILTRLVGQDFGARNYDAWDNWLDEAE